MKIEQTMELIKERRSIRRFSKEKVDRNQIKLLIEAAIWAPSGSNAQAWKFVVLDDETTLRRITGFIPGVLQTPPAMICLCMDYRLELERAGKLGVEILGIMDISMAAQNIMLAAQTMHLGSCAIRGFNEDVIKLSLNLPQHIKPELLIILGKPSETVNAPARKSVEDVLLWQKYQNKDEVYDE